MSEQAQSSERIVEQDPVGSIFLPKDQDECRERIPISAYPVKLFVEELLRLGDDEGEAVKFLQPNQDEDPAKVQALFRAASGQLWLRPQNVGVYRTDDVLASDANYENLSRAHRRLDIAQGLSRSTACHVGEIALENIA